MHMLSITCHLHSPSIRTLKWEKNVILLAIASPTLFHQHSTFQESFINFQHFIDADD